MNGRRYTAAQRLLSLLTLLLLLWGLACSVAMADTDSRVVRVGIFPLGNFHSMGEDDTARGYDVDYLVRVTEYTHWNVTYVPCENWADAMAQLDASQVDLIAPAQKTPEREGKYLFSAMSMSTEMGTVQVPTQRDDLVYGDMTAMAGLHYGAMANSPLTEEFITDYTTHIGSAPDLTLYDNATDMYAALHAGEVDAIATNIMLGDDTVKMIDRYAPSPVYYITRQDETDLMNELDEAMIELALDDPSFQSELFAQYFAGFSDVTQTWDEQQFVSAMPVITVGCAANHAPLSYVDEATGEVAGIARDILERVGTLSGLHFQFEALPDTDVDYAYLKAHGIRVLCNVEYNTVNRRQRMMHLSLPYLDSEKVLVSRDQSGLSSDSALRIALATGSQTLVQVIAETYPNFIPVVYPTVSGCMDAVLAGSADATLQNRYVADCALTNPAYAALTVMPVNALADKMCLATIEYGNDDPLDALYNDGRLLNIVDKAIKQLTYGETNDIIIKNTSAARYRTTFMDLVRTNRLAVVSFLSVIAMVMVLLIWRQRSEAARSREIAAKNRDLTDAVIQADHANQAKSRFLARMSHEIRTPMNAIVGITAIAREHVDDPARMTDSLEKIGNSSKLLLRIINDVLDMSAIENNQLKLASMSFDLKQVLSSVADEYSAQCHQKGVDLVMNSDLPHELLLGDSLRVQQILMNLVSNAFKFTPAGGEIRITATETEVKADVAYIRFTVADTGCGMTEDMQSRLFRPFEQESVQQAQKHGGSGLGLSITKNLVDMMHGAIKVRSQRDKGSEFTVDLPFHFDPAQPILSDEQRLRDVRALIVDDDRDAAQYTAQLLHRIGIPYDVTVSGEEAVARATEAHQHGSGYDVCFVDWRMPGMDGLEVTRRLRALFDRDTMIIVVSAFGTAEVQAEALEAGADNFVSKPLFQSTVFNLLMNLSGGKYVQETAQPETYDFTGHRVLIAEDNALNREIAVELLSMVNLQSECATDGRQAVDMFSASAPGYYEAILMDIQMPVMDGLTATRTIRAGQHPRGKDVPIFAMTANALAQDVTASLSAGMNGHIAKPIDTKVLYEALASVLLKP